MQFHWLSPLRLKGFYRDNLFSFNSFLISIDIGFILSTKTCDKISLNSEKFFPENSLIDFSKGKPDKA